MHLENMADFFNTRAEIYDDHMLDDLGLDEFYEEIAELVISERDDFSLLDLGCGTGLELMRLFDKYPSMFVTGIDLSENMLVKLKEKYPNKNLNLLCGSYFDLPFGNVYDIVLSTYSLHHFNEEEKLFLYKKIHASLSEKGFFIEGDYITDSIEKQILYVSELERYKKEQNITGGKFFHYDLPMTTDTQIKLYKKAGFSDVRIVKQWDNTCIFVLSK
ncbi:MAG: class I SAM-dependent methyltransferase [Eubacteriales bacterium]|nr:class I SAM-dependent methyltransferase [Eubacteriales bacterium]